MYKQDKDSDDRIQDQDGFGVRAGAGGSAAGDNGKSSDEGGGEIMVRHKAGQVNARYGADYVKYMETIWRRGDEQMEVGGQGYHRDSHRRDCPCPVCKALRGERKSDRQMMRIPLPCQVIEKLQVKSAEIKIPIARLVEVAIERELKAWEESEAEEG